MADSFYMPTLDEIVADYLRDIGLEIPGAVTSSGSDYEATGRVLSQTLLPLYKNGAILSRESFPDLAISQAGLVRWSVVSGVTQQGASYSDGTANVSASIATTIPDGSFLRNPSTGVIYKTVGTTSVSPTPTPAFIVATSVGVTGDAEPGTTLEFLSVPPGVNPVATVVSLSGGGDAWSNAKWASEILKALRARAGGGNIPQLLALCMAIPGVEQAFVYPALRGSGTLDFCIVTSAASGSRVAGVSLLGKVTAALRFGAKAIGGDMIFGLPADVFENTSVAAATAQSVDVTLGYQASLVNPWAAWPASKASDSSTWWTASGSVSSFTVSGSVLMLGPAPGSEIAIFFPSVGFVKGTITSSTAGGPGTYTITVAWQTTPAETSIPTGTIVMPWNPMLPKLAGAPVSGSLSLSGAIFDYFAGLGPGEATTLLPEDVTRRCRWPRQSDTDPITGEIEWPTDIGGRLLANVYAATDTPSVTLVSASATTPFVPASAFIGTPPSILVPGSMVVLPP